jgi:DNA-binding FadR family transcriptional regulator
MSFKEITVPTLRDLLIEQLLGMILSGELYVGEKLPSERELAEKMNISRSIVHLGLEDLEHMGFITVLPRKGNYVADFWKEGNFDTLGAVVKYSGGKFDRNTEISMVELRNAIEGGAMIRLSKVHSSEDIAALRDIIEEFRAAAKAGADIRKLAGIMKSFHIEISRLSGNYFFPLVMNSFGKVSTPLWENCIKFWGAEMIIRQEEHIIDLIEAGNGHDAALYIENIFIQFLEGSGK